MAKVQEDSFYYVESGVPYQEARIRAACLECWKAKKIPGQAMFWPGKSKGYGDYDLNCSICDKSIHIRETHENQTSV